MTECYLCGLPIEQDATFDHVPPQQFFAPELRVRFNLDRMVTLPTHGFCNRAFGRDEEYVTNALVPAATGTLAADELIRHHANRFRSGRAVGLGHRVLRSFERRPGGLHLPRDLIAIRLDGVRVERVAWKIVRGLFFLEYGFTLPEHTGLFMELQEPENRDRTEAQPLWEVVKSQASKGVYPAVFDYKHYRVEKFGIAVYLWGMLWWDRIMVFVSHRAPGDTGENLLDIAKVPN
ncbi:MAG: hypothetical protein ACYC3F_01120 [Gemmatimonadaceae bacterium]